MANETIEEQRQRDYQFHLDIAEKIAPTWEKRRARVEEYSAPVRQWMLRELDPQEGDTLLELAAGVGDTGFEAAEIIGGSGRLITSDFSPAMLDAARRRGTELGLGNVDYRVINAEHITLDDDSVDGVLCRFGYMLMPDPAAAFAETRRVLRPAGRVALAVWGAMEHNPWIAIAGISLGQRGHIPPPPPPPALLVAYRYPELLRSLVLLEPPAFPLLGVNIPPTPRQVLRLLARNPRAGIGFIKFGARGVGPAMKAFDRGDDEHGLRVFMTAVAGKDRVAAIPEETFQTFVGNVGPFKAQLRAGFPQFGEDDARSIRVPTLLVSGAETPAPLTAVTDRLEKLLPAVSRLNIAGASHNMFNSHPAEFNAGVMDFIGRH